jgi:hypothetical protein
MSVYFDPAVGGDGSTHTDDSDQTTGIRVNWRTSFIVCLSNLVAIAQNVVTNATAAAASAASAVLAPGTSATSTTSMSIGTGSKAFTLAQTGKNFAVGMTAVIARTSAAATTLMIGRITAFNSGTGAITVEVSTTVGSGGPFTDWTISLGVDAAGTVASSRTISAGGIATGGGDLSANRTITVTKSTAAQVRSGTDDATAVTPKAAMDALAIQTLTDGATVNWDMGASPNAKVTLGGNRTLAQPTGYKEGATYANDLIQDGVGGRTCAFASCYDFGVVGAPTLSTGANKRDRMFAYCYDAVTPRFACTFWKAA